MMKVYIIQGIDRFGDGDYIHSVYLNEGNAKKICEELNKVEEVKEHSWFIYIITEREVVDAE